MFLRKLSILLSSLLLFRCNDNKEADYFTYLQVVKEQPKPGNIDNSKIQVNFRIEENFKIYDTSQTENIQVQIGFNGLIHSFPEDLRFELYANDQKILIPDTIDYSVSTVINNAVRHFITSETTYQVKEILDSVKKKNNLPDSISYFSVAGMIKNIPLNNKDNPNLLKLHLKAFSKGKAFFEKEQVYELKRPKLYNLRSRPFG